MEIFDILTKFVIIQFIQLEHMYLNNYNRHILFYGNYTSIWLLFMCKIYKNT